eukprot:GHVU01195585.1.p1 GENE.GHVU01195585.1~~GHVU01195585.1.p1  ORF type:complete len:120 (+),score=8.24 GHVU01195585.1:514-873(+)
MTARLRVYDCVLRVYECVHVNALAVALGPVTAGRPKPMSSVRVNDIVCVGLQGLLRTLIKHRLLLALPRTLLTPDMLRTTNMFHSTRAAKTILQMMNPDQSVYGMEISTVSQRQATTEI